jgi:hypothetical protein
MAFTADDLNTIDRAIASGVKRVTFADGRTTEYQDVAAMVKARDLIQSEINRTTTAAAGIRRKRFAVFGTGV